MFENMHLHMVDEQGKDLRREAQKAQLVNEARGRFGGVPQALRRLVSHDQAE